MKPWVPCPGPHKTRGCMLMIPAFQKFKVILGYMEKSRPVWVSVAIQKGGKKGGGGIQVGTGDREESGKG